MGKVNLGNDGQMQRLIANRDVPATKVANAIVAAYSKDGNDWLSVRAEKTRTAWVPSRFGQDIPNRVDLGDLLKKADSRGDWRDHVLTAAGVAGGVNLAARWGRIPEMARNGKVSVNELARAIREIRGEKASKPRLGR